MKKILLIDDSEYIIEGTASLLRFEGYEVITANNGQDGVKLAREEQPDLIICDVSMPGMDGFGVLKELRSCKETETLRFIFLTARAEKSDMRSGMEYGADDYLIKPFTVEELLSAI
jgi:DNA-binding response OmpR family regulator